MTVGRLYRVCDARSRFATFDVRAGDRERENAA